MEEQQVFSERLFGWMSLQGHPVTCAEVLAQFGCSIAEVETACEAGSIRCKQVAPGVSVLFLPSLLATKRTAAAKAQSQHLSSGPSPAKRSKVVAENRNLVLSELKRKKLMIEKHTSAKSKETVELEELITKWQEAGLLALEDLARHSGGERSLSELCKTIGVDGKLLGVEIEDEEEEEE